MRCFFFFGYGYSACVFYFAGLLTIDGGCDLLRLLISQCDFQTNAAIESDSGTEEWDFEQVWMRVAVRVWDS
jgi:hypothetical protein